jgi:hypothetical protein
MGTCCELQQKKQEMKGTDGLGSTKANKVLNLPLRS